MAASTTQAVRYIVEGGHRLSGGIEPGGNKNAQQIERGYERIDERLNALGARIIREPQRL